VSVAAIMSGSEMASASQAPVTRLDRHSDGGLLICASQSLALMRCGMMQITLQWYWATARAGGYPDGLSGLCHILAGEGEQMTYKGKYHATY